MQLYCSTTSPFARKCRALIHLCELADRVELVLVDPFSDNTQLRDANPLGKIPTLVDGNLNITDSPLICEYLAEQADCSIEILGKHTPSYYPIQVCHANADGILDAAVASVFERRRDTEPSSYWLDRWDRSIKETIRHADITHLGTASSANIATIAFMVALGYLDFRREEIHWREYNPELAAWYAAIENQKWFSSTRPD